MSPGLLILQSPPLRMMAQEREQPLPAAGPGRDLDKRSLKALVVEDELLVAWHLEALLADLGHEVCAVAAHAEAAASDFAEFLPDLVFMDVNLGPGPSGIEVARSLRSVREVPVVFVTAYSDPKNRKAMTEAAPGCVILAKPVSPGELEQAIEAVTGSQH